MKRVTRTTGSMTISFDFEMTDVAPTRILQVLQELQIVDTPIEISDLKLHFETERR